MMKDVTTVEAAKVKAEARFKKQQEQADAAQAGRKAAEAIKVAEAAKTVRLKALRIAKEQAEETAAALAPPVKKRASRTVKVAAAR
jgi:hypothetical protein